MTASTTNPDVAAALEARALLGQAFRTCDLDALARLLAADLVVNAPINRIVDRDDLLDRVRRGEAHQAHGPTTTGIEFAEPRNGLVVIMGDEVIHPAEHTPHANPIRRRFTDIWRPHAHTWQLAICQTTIPEAKSS